MPLFELRAAFPPDIPPDLEYQDVFKTLLVQDVGFDRAEFAPAPKLLPSPGEVLFLSPRRGPQFGLTLSTKPRRSAF